MRKQILSLLLIPALVISLAACGSDQEGKGGEQAAGSENQTSGQENTVVNTAYDALRVATDQVPEKLKPLAETADPDFAIINALYEPLFDLADDDGSLSPCLASGYSQVDDRQWLVNLQDDIYDWDGNNLTADDVAFSFNRLLEQGTVSGYDCFDSIEVIDSYSFYINWTRDLTDPSEAVLPLTETFIFSETAWNDTDGFETGPVGTGCYRVSEYTPGATLTLEANGSYWAMNYLDAMTDRHRAKVQSLTLQVMTDADAVAGLQDGTVDICGSLSVSEAAQFRDESYAEQYQVLTCEEDGFWYLGANTNTVSKNLRFALFYGLNDEAIAAAMGPTYSALDSFGTTGQSDWEDGMLLTDGYEAGQDLEKAGEYLADTDYTGSTLELVCLNSTASMQAARQIQEQAAELGITLEITSVSEDRYPLIVNTDETRRWDLALGFVEGPTVRYTWSQLIGDTDGGNILYLIADTNLRDLNEAMTSEEEEPELAQIEESQAYVVENAYLYPVAVSQKNIVYTTRIKNPTYHDGYFDIGESLSE